jgi:CBS domain-containing protein
MAEQEQQTVRDQMADTPATIRPDATVAEAARTMRDADVSFIAVVDDTDTLIGVITDRDIAITVVAADVNPNSATVGQAMSEPVAVSEGDSLDQALQRMLDENVHRAPVTDGEGHVSGTLSQESGS